MPQQDAYDTSMTSSGGSQTCNEIDFDDVGSSPTLNQTALGQTTFGLTTSHNETHSM